MDSDSEDGSNQSSPSPSPSPGHQSPTASFHAEPSLEQLTTHFVNAKRSLATTQHLYRADELVKSSRGLVEDIAVLSARHKYATDTAQESVRVLEGIKRSIEAQTVEANSDFTKVIQRLDEAHGRLAATLKTLEGTIIDGSLQRHGPNAQSGSAETSTKEGSEQPEREGKTLLDFIDTSKHESIKTSLHAQIDDFGVAREELAGSLDTFGRDVQVLNSLLAPSEEEEPPNLLRPALYDEPALSVPDLFHSISDNAGTMAALVQSLLSHYDLCVTALKHTEGGGQAARQAVEQQRKSDSSPALDGEDTLSKSKENLAESLYRKDHASQISAEERQEMLKVLERDSDELEDVVAELGDHARDLESAFDKLAARARKARERDGTIRQVVHMLHEMQTIHLPSLLHSMETFSADWARIRSTIDAGTLQLSDLSDFYAEFFEGYKKLLRELDRRKAVRAQMRKIAEKAEREIGRVFEADEKARHVFMEQVGSVLPGDLWPSLHSESRRWRVVEVGAGGEGGYEEQRTDETMSDEQ